MLLFNLISILLKNNGIALVLYHQYFYTGAVALGDFHSSLQD